MALGFVRAADRARLGQIKRSRHLDVSTVVVTARVGYFVGFPPLVLALFVGAIDLMSDGHKRYLDTLRLRFAKKRYALDLF